MPAHPTLLHALQYWEERRPGAVFLTQPLAADRVRDYTWREVGDQARRVAEHIRARGLPAGSKIALLGKSSAHWIMADLAIWLAGHVSVPLYPTANAETVRYVLEHCEAKLLFVGKLDEFWPFVKPGIPEGLPLVALPLAPKIERLQWDQILAAHAPIARPAERNPAELATIIYTPGSTGKPKGVMTSFGAMVATPRGLGQVHDLSGAQRVLSCLPLAHAAERAMLEAPALYFGWQVHFAWSPDTFLADLRRARPTLLFPGPRLWTKLHATVSGKLPPGRRHVVFRIPLLGRWAKRRVLRQLGLEQVKVAIAGSAPLAPALAGGFRDLGLELLESYAMTENFSYSHGSRPGRTRPGYVGECNPGVECRIAANGEVLVKSPATMIGYYKEPQRTWDDFTPDGFLKTGDMGELDEQGRLRITGRVQELFKTSKGKYVAPVPIENRLADHPQIEAVCVAGVGQPQPFALVMLTPEARQAAANDGHRGAVEQELASLVDRVNASLEPHEALDFVAVVRDPWTMQNGYLTPTMKIRRSLIERRYEPQVAQWGSAGRKVVWE